MVYGNQALYNESVQIFQKAVKSFPLILESGLLWLALVNGK